MTHDENMVYKVIAIVYNDIKTSLKLKILNILQMGVQVNVKIEKIFKTFVSIMKILIFLPNGPFCN